MTDEGWMNASLFRKYISDTFYKYLNKNHVELPVVVFCPKHFSANINTKTQQFCKDHGIILVCLPSVLNVIDAVISRPFRTIWPDAILKWKAESKAAALTKVDFCPLLKKLLKDSVSVELFQEKFTEHHLFPFGDAEDIAEAEVDGGDGQDNEIEDVKLPDFLAEHPLLPFGNAEDVIKPEEHDEDDQDNEISRPDLLLTRNVLVRMIDDEKVTTFCRFYALHREDEEWDGDLADKNLYAFWKELVDRC